MIELSELCGQIDPSRVASAANQHEMYFVVGPKVYKKASTLHEWAVPGFDATSITINKTGTLVALSSASQVAVYTSDAKLVLQEKLKVHKVLWHPLGLDDACLTVLSEGFVRNFWQSPQGVMTDTFDFSHHGVGAQDGPQFSTSMTFGTGATGPFCLYLMTDEASIFALCPFLPPTFQLTKRGYNDLLDYAASAHFSYKDTPDSRLYKQQLEWIKTVEPQLKSPQLSLDELLYTIEAPDLGPLCCQGPFCITPFPKQLYSQDFIDIAALRYQNLDLLAVASTEKVLFLLVDEPTPLMWVFSKPQNYGPDLALVQARSVDAKPSPQLQTTETLVWVHAGQSTMLVVPDFVQALEQALGTQGQVPRLEPAPVTKLPRSVVVPHVLSASAHPVAQLHNSREVRYIGAPTTLAAADLEDESRSVSPPLEIFGDIASRHPINPAPSHVAGPIEESLESLGKMDKVAQDYEAEIIKLFKSITVGVDALSLGKSELHRQLEILSKFDIKDDGRDRKELLADAVTRQDAIAERVRKLDAKTREIRNYQPVGRAEQRWFGELRSASSTVDKLDARLHSTQQALTTLPDGEPCKQDLSDVLARLQGLTSDIEALKQKCIRS